MWMLPQWKVISPPVSRNKISPAVTQLKTDFWLDVYPKENPLKQDVSFFSVYGPHAKNGANRFDKTPWGNTAWSKVLSIVLLKRKFWEAKHHTVGCMRKPCSAGRNTKHVADAHYIPAGWAVKKEMSLSKGVPLPLWLRIDPSTFISFPSIFDHVSVEVHWSDVCVRADGGEGSRMYRGGEIEAEVMAVRPTSPNKHTEHEDWKTLRRYYRRRS